MTAETKEFIESHIDMIENNGIGSTYLDCPLRILDDFNNSMHIVGIEYPPEIHAYIVLCCYMANQFKGIRLQNYEFDYNTEKEVYEFDCDFYKYYVDKLTHDISVLLPERTVEVTVEEKFRFTGHCRLRIHVKVN